MVPSGVPQTDRAAVGAIFVSPANSDHLMESVLTARNLGVELLVGAPHPAMLADFGEFGCETIVTQNIAETINVAWTDYRTHVLAFGDAVSAAKGLLESGLQLLGSDLRLATVSYFSNDGGFLSFPHRNRRDSRPPEGMDAESISRKLGQKHLGPPEIPILIAGGPLVFLSASALGAVGPLDAGPENSFTATIADFSARARYRGFLHVVDSTNFVARRRGPGSDPLTEWPIDEQPAKDRHWFYLRHPKDLSVLKSDAELHSSPISIGHRLARAKVYGLRIAVDGYDLGPHEMGTQVGLLSTVSALNDHPDVYQTLVVMSGPIPRYAQGILSHPKVRTEVIHPTQFGELERCDIAHRMAQPNPGFDVGMWRQLGERVIVSILDVIAYRNGAYHTDHEDWLIYRETIRRNISQVDAVTTISDDVRHQVELERLPIDSDRLESIPFGTEHLRGEQRVEIPQELLKRGFASEPFVVCIGTDYAHKNRDLAIGAMDELRGRGWPHSLFLVGPTVPDGSSRRAESKALLRSRHLDREHVVVLPEVESAERNWLLKHAAVVLYPSSAEGFGFVPYEAACFGTPTVFVGFGPLAELAPDTPVTARDWSPGSLADALEQLLADPDLAASQVASYLAAGSNYTWAETAKRLIDLYYRTLSVPARSG